MTTVINIKKMPRLVGTPDYVYIGRGSIYGNPFSWQNGTGALVMVNDREEAISSYLKWINGEITLEINPPTIEQILALEGKTLGCFCRPEWCHGDILKEIIEDHKLQEFYSENEASEIP